MLFWVRNIIFGGVLAALAYFFFANQDLLSSFGDGNKANSTAPAPKVDTTAISTPEVEKKTPKKEKPKEENQAAKSLSKFYAKINGDPNVEVPTIRNNIVYLPAPSGDLETLLNARKKIVRAYPQNWKGTVKSYPFRLGETIGGKLSDFAEQDKLKVFWRLNRDYVVKDAFRINKNILKAALQLGQGIDGHFQNGVSIYFCYASRSIVVIEGTKSYLNERCSLLKSNSGY
jgi:hypothetical protein